MDRAEDVQVTLYYRRNDPSHERPFVRVMCSTMDQAMELVATTLTEDDNLVDGRTFPLGDRWVALMPLDGFERQVSN